MAPGIYRVEIAPSNRAGCQNTECKKQGIKIPKGALRLGVFVTIMENQTWKWKHWGCATPQVIASVKEGIEDNVDLLDGCDELPEDMQDKVKRALAQGHVDDDDWSGDVEMNRPGMKGYRTPASKKKQREEAKALKEVQTMENEEAASPSKPSKKRGYVNDEADAGDGDNQEQAPKKRKTAPKKPQNTENGINGESAKKSKPANKFRKNTKTRKKEVEYGAGVKEESSAQDAVPPLPAKKPRASRKTATSKKVKSEGNDGDDLNDAPEAALVLAKKKRALPQTASTRTIKEEENKTNMAIDVHEPIADTPKPPVYIETKQDYKVEADGEDGAKDPKPTSKKSGNKAVNGKENGAATTAKTKSKQQLAATTDADKPKRANLRAKRGQA